MYEYILEIPCDVEILTNNWQVCQSVSRYLRVHLVAGRRPRQQQEDRGVQDLQWFDINHVSGLITTRLNIDRETQAQLQLVG